MPSSGKQAAEAAREDSDRDRNVRDERHTTPAHGPRLEGKVAIVTGASRGIGRAIAARLVAEGARVCITARNAERLEQAAQELGGPSLAIAVAGASDDSRHQAVCVERTLDAFGRIDVLVNNTGVNPAYGSLFDLEPSAGRKIMEVNVLGSLAWTREAFLRWMGDHGGCVVNISSVAGILPAEGIGFYGASKAALTHITAQLALEVGPRVRVNAVAPAVVRTRFANALYAEREEEVAGQYVLQRIGTPDDVAASVAFLASSDASWMTGQTLVLDGGLTLRGGIT
jgi:3-oxoacyl-[acyl-carrier protein] reductase